MVNHKNASWHEVLGQGTPESDFSCLILTRCHRNCQVNDLLSSFDKFLQEKLFDEKSHSPALSETWDFYQDKVICLKDFSKTITFL